MKKERSYIKFICMFFIYMFGYFMLGFQTIPAYSQEDMKAIDNSVFENPKRPASIFVHDLHNTKAGLDDCSVCHHVYDEQGKLSQGESSEDKKCADCHEINSSGNKPGLMKAYHFNCKSCHIEKGSGPIMCGQCHKTIQD